MVCLTNDETELHTLKASLLSLPTVTQMIQAGKEDIWGRKGALLWKVNIVSAIHIFLEIFCLWIEQPSQVPSSFARSTNIPGNLTFLEQFLRIYKMQAIVRQPWPTSQPSSPTHQAPHLLPSSCHQPVDVTITSIRLKPIPFSDAWWVCLSCLFLFHGSLQPLCVNCSRFSQFLDWFWNKTWNYVKHHKIW